VGAVYFSRLEQALASPTAPTVLWLEGGACSGCSVSLLNRISTTAPKTISDVLLTTINLQYHPTLMAAMGQDAVDVVNSVIGSGNYILAVEGEVPTAFGGAACWPWSDNGVDETFQSALGRVAAGASQVLCVGTCSSFGGVAAAPPNPTGAMSVGQFLGRSTINVAGCPPHPDWIIWTIAQLVAGLPIPLDKYGRPTALYGKTVHSQCPRQDAEDASTYGQDRRCLEEMGCRGPNTYGNCPTQLWNNRANWCVDANSQCIGCTSSDFPASPIRGGHGN
jgi:hydrogenase small subunit